MDDTCQICGSGRMVDFVRHEEGHFLRCKNCGLIVNANATALAADAADYYDDPDHCSGYNDRFPRKIRRARRRLDVVQSYVGHGALLDIGCGIGNTLTAARDASFEPVGMDTGDYPVQYCRELGFKVIQGSLTDIGIADASFDVVTMWDVLEHIPRTSDGLSEVERVLKPGGVVAIIVPSGEYLKLVLLRNTYRGFRRPYSDVHFVYHTRHTLRTALRNCGLQPLHWPAFRVGALKREFPSALLEIIVALPRYLVLAAWNRLRLAKNIFMLARKPKQ